MSGERIGADEIMVRDGHLRIRLLRMEDGWHAEIVSEIEGPIFEGHVNRAVGAVGGPARRLAPAGC